MLYDGSNADAVVCTCLCACPCVDDDARDDVASAWWPRLLRREKDLRRDEEMRREREGRLVGR